MIKPTKYLLLGLTLYTLPIIIFGDFSKTYQYILLPISLVVFYWRMVKNIRSENAAAYINGALLGFFLSMFGLSPFIINVNKTLIEISLTYGNIFGYWISFISYYIMYHIYREKMNEYKMEQFDYDFDKLERDKKIDAIIRRF